MKTHRERWLRKPRRRCGTAPGPNFCKPRAQWPGRNRGTPLRFCAPEMFCPLQGVTPVTGSGESGPMDLGGAKRSRSPSAASPAILKVNCPEGAREGGLGHWFLSHRWERNSPPAGGETPLRKEPSSGPMRASGPTKKRSIIAPSSVTASPCHLPPRGKAFGGSAPHPPPLRGHLPPQGEGF